MIIKATSGTTRITVRSIGGEKLDEPIDVEFTHGEAEVDPEVARRLDEVIPGIEIVRYTEDPEED